MGGFISLSPLVSQQDPIMSHAISQQSTSGSFNFERAFPYLRTLIDMLLVTGALFHLGAISSVLFASGTGWPLLVFKAVVGTSFVAAGVLAFTTARFNHLKYRRVALICVAILLLVYASISATICGLCAISDITSDLNWFVMGVATWGLVCVGLISIENRLAVRLAIADEAAPTFSIRHTALRLAALPFCFMYSLNWIILPIWVISFLANPNARLEQIQECWQSGPAALLESTSLITIYIWFLAAQGGLAFVFWYLLKSFHTPGVDLSQVLKKEWEGCWANIFQVVVMIGMVGFVALLISYNATSFGLSSLPWILAAMFLLSAFGCWRLQKKESTNGSRR